MPGKTLANQPLQRLNPQPLKIIYHQITMLQLPGDCV